MAIIIGALMLGLATLLLVKQAQGATSEISPAPAGSSSSWDSIVRIAAELYQVAPAIIKAVIKREQGGKSEAAWDANAINPNDPSYGVMQVTPMVAQDFGLVKDWRTFTAGEKALLMQPQQNVNVGTWQLARLLAKYPFDVAVQMYNVGEDGYNNHGYRAAGYLADVRKYYAEYTATS